MLLVWPACSQVGSQSSGTCLGCATLLAYTRRQSNDETRDSEAGSASNRMT